MGTAGHSIEFADDLIKMAHYFVKTDDS